MPPVAYLSWSYYEHWYFVTALSLLQAGMITVEELRTGHAAAGTPEARRCQPARTMWTDLQDGRQLRADRCIVVPLRRRPDRKARNMQPIGHTRLPRYARGKAGIVQRWHGAHVLPDTNAHGERASAPSTSTR